MLRKIVNGAVAATLFAAGIAGAQTTSPTTTPGVPNTGAGDAVVHALILGASAMVAVLGALYLFLQRRMSTE